MKETVEEQPEVGELRECEISPVPNGKGSHQRCHVLSMGQVKWARLWTIIRFSHTESTGGLDERVSEEGVRRKFKRERGPRNWRECF